MSTALVPPEPHRPPAVAALGRGTTHIEDRAVARIAARAASDALEAHASPGQRTQAPHVRIATAGGAVRVALQIHLPYPADLSAVCTRLQDHVAVRLAEMTGLHVPEVRVGIQHFIVDPVGTPRSPVVDLTKPPAHHGPRGPALVGGDSAAAKHTARVPSRWWAARRIPAALTAMLVMGASGLLIYDIVAAGQEDLSRWAQGPLVRQLSDRSLGSAWTIFAAVLCAALGLWLIVPALTPGRRRQLPLRPQDQDPAPRAALDRTSAAVAMRDAALSVPGVTTARVRLRRRVTVRAVSSFGDPQQIDTDLTHTMNQALDGLCLAHPLALRLRIR
ncbi:DUF6286 domain-containing protein [Streptomyces sp. H27-G5]|uniref:DUF6286 domain-containing Asp23/Gls24 family envelope stress response protein n=1 Tax=Streptomyces sp. H27-G5 TaxID=2996698 RepID=UPI002270CBF1|nr:DUF6286 domain-containing Asp23/Gls24 family envelope stress response protein [Streptomyces sp. H27-G5]MCY0916951.1 DUF6286 domain-containing protein [Streptomyces sp. H27-G5]